jgi:hypothetical protein
MLDILTALTEDVNSRDAEAEKDRSPYDGSAPARIATMRGVSS